MERSIANAGESKQGMIASYFHLKLKGNLSSFNSHKTFIIFLLCRDSSLTAPGWLWCSAVVPWVPGRKARSKCWEWGLEEGVHQQQSGARKGAEVLAEEQEPQFLPQLPANIWRKGWRAMPWKGKAARMQSQPPFPRLWREDSQAAAQVTDTWWAQARETTAPRVSPTSASWKSTTQNQTSSGVALQPHFSTIQSLGDIELQALLTTCLPERDGGMLVTGDISRSKIKNVSSLLRLLNLQVALYSWGLDGLFNCKPSKGIKHWTWFCTLCTSKDMEVQAVQPPTNPKCLAV